jgi:heterodisulfide reductase subunit B
VKSSYAYYPGCLASLSQKELDTSTRAIADKLGMTLVDVLRRGRRARGSP